MLVSCLILLAISDLLFYVMTRILEFPMLLQPETELISYIQVFSCTTITLPGEH